MKKPDRSSGNRKDAGQGSIKSDLEETKVGLGAERKKVGQRINCDRGEPKPIHDHSRLRPEIGGSLPGKDQVIGSNFDAKQDLGTVVVKGESRIDSNTNIDEL